MLKYEKPIFASSERRQETFNLGFVVQEEWHKLLPGIFPHRRNNRKFSEVFAIFTKLYARQMNTFT